MTSKKATRALEAKLSQLKHAFGELVKQIEETEKEIQSWPVKVIVVHGQKHKLRRVVSEQVDRIHNDSLRALGRIEYEIRETESLLHPSWGRENEPIYRQAQRDLAANPQLKVRQLAEKYLPHYFPKRAESAMRMMDQGLRRLNRKKTSYANKK
jgi:hypothetical protein